MTTMRAERAPSTIISQLVIDAQKDPLLPRPNPTKAFWQWPPSPISKTQSARLPSKTTYAIIGSGVTGCSVATHLLHSLSADSRDGITILEARTLTSGATGRNGGHLLSPLPEEFLHVEKVLGREETAKISRFAIRTLESMYALADEDEALSKAAEARRVTTITGYYDKDTFETAKESQKRYEESLPEFRGDHRVYTAEEGLKEFNMKDTVGVITNSAGAFWPYRLVTGLYSRMLTQYQDRFSIETETPVTEIDYAPAEDAAYPYTVTTARGVIRASKVIHCTNGWAGHLLPNLRGKIFPVRGTMSTQAAGPEFPREGEKKSWSTVGRPSYDASDETFSYGLYYITQNEKTGDIFIGGERQKALELLTADDTTISSVSKDTLVNILPKIFAKGWPSGQQPEIKSIWSGVLGFTADHLPWVGRVPKSVSTRHGDGEYIAAGFNGYGMPLCWGSGEAVAKMILGEDDEVREWLPISFEMTSKRLNSPCSTAEAGILNLFGQEPD
ncbi:uncharacterized protein MYCFIDRAFT_152562 [Pseudocercospora fijiensis CIRAD86]|uniref:FAD dependent oxidoreductase domain-containing protein n=1 Tax=Pseudocercospora fijiensis (strain CIRAD86) TaxID=383855 RepID=M2ZZJ2_PSEFD|nr:uncharacterized protein MYCFIDRAFT_152562 [Pseudocercospora fijiensis CIRAD86]EME84329.1 hypothetical protein MYCFIDRAFT_152562 [Pseudocercospora fijiensis CIRAD86]